MSHDVENGYKMGVYLCLGQAIHEVNFKDAEPFSKYGSFMKIQEALISKPSNDNSTKTVIELKNMCKDLGYNGYSKKKKTELIQLIEEHQGNVKDNVIFILLGYASHKIKKKAEQQACERAIQSIQ
jgi:Rho termination factor, N-terminal domain.